MDIKEITFLSNDQVFGGSKALELFKRYGTKAAITDFAIFLGGYVNDNNYIDEDNTLKNRTGCWWTKTCDSNYNIFEVDFCGNVDWNFNDNYSIGGRPALYYKSISTVSLNKLTRKNKILEVEYGEYPQDIVSEELARTLEYEYSNSTINQTGKSYATYFAGGMKDKVINHIEYEFKGKKYIRLVSDLSCSGTTLSNGEIIENFCPYWIAVKPIKWLVDEQNKICLSKKILFSGVPFDCQKIYTGNFKNTVIKRFMDEYFIKDIVPSKEKNLNEIDVLLEEIRKFAKYSDDIEKLENHINMLIEEYNNDIETLAENKLQLKLDSSSGYKQKLIINLQNILDNLKKLYNKKHTYEEIIEFLKKLKKIILGEKIESDVSLITDFVKIYEALDYINNYYLDKEFVDLIDLEINKIENYLKNIYDKNKKIEYDDQKSFELYFRTKIHPLLTKMHVNIVNRNVINEMTKIIKNEIDELNKNQKSSVIEFFLNEIKKEVAVIKNIDTNKNHEETLKHLLNIHYDKLGSEKTTLKVLTDILVKLYEIELDITNKQNIRNQKIMTKFKVLN